MSPAPTTALTTNSSSVSAARTGVRAAATFWHAITGSLLAMHWRLRGFPTGEDPHATVRELRRCTKSRGTVTHERLTTPQGGEAADV